MRGDSGMNRERRRSVPYSDLPIRRGARGKLDAMIPGLCSSGLLLEFWLAMIPLDKKGTADSIWEKVAEARFFLERMTDADAKSDHQPFGYYLSAFLNAFRSIAYRAFRFTARAHGRPARDKLKAKVEAAADLKFLTEARDVEVHQDGVTLVLVPKLGIGPADFVLDRWPDRFTKFVPRTTFKYDSKYNKWPTRTVHQPRTLHWRFGDRLGHDSITFCAKAVDELERLVREAIDSHKADAR